MRPSGYFASPHFGPRSHLSLRPLFESMHSSANMNAAVSEVPNAVSFEAFTHRRSQGGQRGHALYKLLAYLAVLCFKRRRPKANSGAR